MAAEIHRNVVFLGLVFEARELLFAFCIDCHPKRGRGREQVRVRPQGGGDERARVCRPNVFAATDVSIANFHLAFPPSPSISLPFSLPRLKCMSRWRRSNYSPPSLISSSERGRGATAPTVVVWSQFRLLLSTRLARRVRSSVHLHTQPPGGWGASFCRGRAESYSA